jgi:hypothetical protein
MAFKIPHGASPGTALPIAFAGGVEETRRKAEAEQRGIAAQKELREHEFELREDLMEGKAALETDMMYDRMGVNIEEFEYKLTPQQRADRARYANALYEIDSRDDWSDEEKRQAKAVLNDRVAAAEKPQRFRKEPSVPISEKFGKETHQDEYGNVYAYSKKTDQWKKIGTVESKQRSTQDETKVREIAMKMSVNPKTGNVDPEAFKRNLAMLKGEELPAAAQEQQTREHPAIAMMRRIPGLSLFMPPEAGAAAPGAQPFTPPAEAPPEQAATTVPEYLKRPKEGAPAPVAAASVAGGGVPPGYKLPAEPKTADLSNALEPSTGMSYSRLGMALLQTEHFGKDTAKRASFVGLLESLQNAKGISEKLKYYKKLKKLIDQKIKKNPDLFTEYVKTEKMIAARRA